MKINIPQHDVREKYSFSTPDNTISITGYPINGDEIILELTATGEISFLTTVRYSGTYHNSLVINQRAKSSYYLRYDNGWSLTPIYHGEGGGVSPSPDPEDTDITKLNNTFSEFKKIDDYLYEVTMRTIPDYEYAKQYFENYEPNVVGHCTSFRNGDIYGTNLDWGYNNECEFIIHTPRIGKKYASTTVAAAIPELTKDFVESQKWSDEYLILPFSIVNGINEKKVFGNVNVVSAEDLTQRTTGTTPTLIKKDRICSIMLLKYILDNFATADEAIDYITKYVEVYSPNIMYDFHIMLGDPNKTYVIEFVDNTIKVTEHAIMTNFRIYGTTHDADGHITYTSVHPFGQGLERYDILVDNIENITDLQSALDLTGKDLKYTNSYTEGQWLTEFTGLYSNPEHTGAKLTVQDAASHPEKFDYILQAAREAYLNRSRDTGETWHTVHSCIYDFESLGLTIHIQQNSKKIYNIPLLLDFDAYDPEIEYQSSSLNTDFGTAITTADHVSATRTSTIPAITEAVHEGKREYEE